MLIKTMELEVADDALFAKETPLLGASTELVYHTLNCSALNVEELRREKGSTGDSFWGPAFYTIKKCNEKV